MSFLEIFIDEYKKVFTPKKPVFDSSLMGKIKQFSYELQSEEFNASSDLVELLDKLKVRGAEPMKIAITGQFSSGKSTFLNALLSKNVLPTGITPVTSKVNYIRYGDEFKIKVKYANGVEEYYGVDGLSRFTDQREEVEDVLYLTLYAPLELLKDVVFVDTPGLNSQAKVDTKTTKQVLKEVDGIIWLTLIDNAGKMSEAEVLEEYMDAYANKSLCVLNQKDKFTDEQIMQTTQYVKKAFSQFFAQVIPISALQALKARSHDSKQQVDELYEKYTKMLKTQISLPSNLENSQKLDEEFNEFKSKAKQIFRCDTKENLELLKLSNIEQVLDFIHTQIQPQATKAKRYALSKEAQDICDKLILQQNNIICIYDELAQILLSFHAKTHEVFNELKSKFAKQIKNAFLQIENMIEKTASEIFNHVQTEQKTRYAKKQIGLLKKQQSYESIEYEVSKIHTDTVYKKLFYDDDVIGKMFKKYVKNLSIIQNDVNEQNDNIYKNLEHDVLQWQKPYELIRKNEQIHSDVEYANVRKFASKAYENFLKDFNDEIKASYAQISSQFNHLSSAVSFNYQNATEVCVAFLEHKINESIKLYEENPTKFSLYSPKIDEIKNRLRVSFHMYELENMMNTKHTFLDKNYDLLIKNFAQIKIDKINFIEDKKLLHVNVIKRLNTLKDMFDKENN